MCGAQLGLDQERIQTTPVRRRFRQPESKANQRSNLIGSFRLAPRRHPGLELSHIEFLYLQNSETTSHLGVGS